MTEVKLFALGSQNVRFGTTEDGTPYAVAADYAKALGYKRTQAATDLLDSDEKGYADIPTSGGIQCMSVIYPKGMIRLMVKSSFPTGTLLPQLIEILDDDELPTSDGYVHSLRRATQNARADVHHLESILRQAGYLYIIETGSGLIKVGRTRNWPRRLSQYEYQASIWGGSIKDCWVSGPLFHVVTAESLMIKACKKKALPAHGREYFRGLSWNSVIKLAEKLETRLVEINGVSIHSSLEYFTGFGDFNPSGGRGVLNEIERRMKKLRLVS